MLKILLLCGGKGNERDISLNSVRSVYDHIKSLKSVDLTVIFFDKSDQKYLIDEEYLYSNTTNDFHFLLKSFAMPMSDDDFNDSLCKFDLVFPVIHGVGGEDGKIQRLLEELNVRFIGSPSEACEKMYNKHTANEQIINVRKMQNIPKLFVKSIAGESSNAISQFVATHGKVCLKPTEGGSSFGVTFADSAEDAVNLVKELLETYDELIIEKKCLGKEFTIIILENNGKPVSLIPTEIELLNTSSEHDFFDLRRKYMPTTEVHYHCPARFNESEIASIRSQAEELFEFVNARDFLRIDGWLLEDGSVYFADFNPISGMEQNSFIFQQAAKVGFTHSTLLKYILDNACNRYGINRLADADHKFEKRKVNVILGGTTSERQVSLLSGTNVWLKLLHSEKYAPTPYILTKAHADDWIVHEIPYSDALLHTTEEIIDQINNQTDITELVAIVQMQLGIPMVENNQKANWIALNEFVKQSKLQNAYVFIGLHGGFGESGGIQSLLDEECVDYNGSAAEASVLCMDKYKTGVMVEELGVSQLRTCKKVLADITVTWDELSDKIGTPIIAKPNGDGCSTGVVKLSDSSELQTYLRYCKTGNSIPPNTFANQAQTIAMPQISNNILFEEYIQTDGVSVEDGLLKYNADTGWIEITIGVLEKCGLYHAFNPSVTVAENAILSVEEKFQGGVGINLTPPPVETIPISLRRRIKYFAEQVAEKCGIEDYCRIDMFANNKTGEVIVIEINTLPGLSPSTVLFQQAAKEITSMSPLALLERIIEPDGGVSMNLTFKEIVSCTGGSTTYTGNDFPLYSIKFDSRQNMRESIFIAFVTDKNDGHKYIPVAASKGAVATIVSTDVNVTIPTIRVKDTIKAYQDIATYYRNKFSIPIIGLTGSNGKTTVKDMLTAVLSAKYNVLATDKNLNNHLGVPQTLLKLNSKHDVAVIEMGMNHHGEIRTLTNMGTPDIAIITKIGTAHMGNLGGTRSDVYRAKMEIIEGLKKGGKLVLNSDDDMLVKVKSEIHDVIFCGLENEDYNLMYASDVSQFWDKDGYGLSFLVHYDGNEYSCTLPILGRHNVQNALLSLTVGVQLGVPIEGAIDALRIYPRSSMRLETSSVHGIKFIKDYYNASPESTKAALNTLGELNTEKTRIAVLGELFELGEQSESLHREIAEYTQGKADRVFYVGNYCDAFLIGRPDAQCFETKEEINFALSSAILNGEFTSGDTVLIKGSNGMKMWEQYEFLRKLLERGSLVLAQTRMLVDVDALKHNYAAIKRYVGSNVLVMPVIKADAYGSGADVVANIYGDCKYIAVADLREADELHHAMPNVNFLVIYQPLITEIDRVLERDYVILSVGDLDFVRELDVAAKKQGKEVVVHIEIDTGMSRLGVVLDDCKEFAEAISKCGNIAVEGIFTHYSSADMYSPQDLEFTEKQTSRFKKAIEIFENVIGQIQYKHASASAAIFNPKAELFDIVRPGYMLFGYYPCDEIRDKISLKPALKYATQVTQVKEFDVGVEVSYGRNFVTQRKTRLAEIPVGYSDGLMRILSNKGAFVINGQLAPIIGMVCMDYTMVDVTDIDPIVWAGDDVYIFDNDNMTIERMAELCGTIGYEIITNIKNKADRIETF